MTEKTRIGGMPGPENVSLWLLFGFTVVAVLGYGVYGRHPELIPQTDFGMSLFAISFQLFAQVHIVVAALVLAVVLARALGSAWLLPFGVVYALSFMAEHIGTGYGIPFGGYGYTALLGAKLGGRVPFLIPVSWFLMALPSWVIARSAIGEGAPILGRIALGSLWLLIWDLALDPAMSFLTPYWIWEESGPYYGMPLANLVGWYVTGLVLMVAIESFSSRVAWRELSVRWMAAYYGAMLLMPLGMLVAAGVWLGAVVTLGAVASATWLTLHLTGSSARGIANAGLEPEAVEARPATAVAP